MIGAVRPAHGPAQLSGARQIRQGIPSEVEARSQFLGSKDRDETKRSRIDQSHLGSGVGAGHEVRVKCLRFPGRGDNHPSRHPQMGDPNHVRVETTEQEFSHSVKAFDHPPPKAIAHVGRAGVAAAGARMPDLDFDQTPTLDHRGQVPANGFDLGKLGHSLTL